MVEAVLFSLSDSAKKLIENYDIGLKERLSSEKFRPVYSTIDDILINKYHLENIDKIEPPDLSDKSEFLHDDVRGNFQKASGNILNYRQADLIVFNAINKELP